MALPNSNISVAMVKSELGAATNDVGQLCIHPNVNKWSKYKPVRHSSVVPITEAQFKESNYGFNIASNTSNNFTGSWSYVKPVGGNSSPFRLTDFGGYDKLEQPPIYLTENYLNQEWNVFLDSNPILIATPALRTGGVAYNGVVNNRLNVEDFKISNTGTWDFKDLYFSLAAKDGSNFRIATSNNPLSSGNQAGISTIVGSPLYTYLSSLSIGQEVTIYPFLNTRGDNVLGTIVPLPQYQPITFKKVREFWVHIDPVSFRASNQNFSMLVNQDLGSGYSSLPSIRSYLMGANPSTQIDTLLTVHIYKGSGGREINLKDFLAKSNHFGVTEQLTVDSMKIVGKKIIGGTFASINKNIIYSDSNTSYNFFAAEHNNAEYFVVEFGVKGNVSTLRDNAINDPNMPVGARYNVDYQLFYKNTMLTFMNAMSMRYRFS